MKHRRNITNTNPPLPGELEEGEITVNLLDGRLHSKDPDGNVMQVGGDVFSVDTVDGLQYAPTDKIVIVNDNMRLFRYTDKWVPYGVVSERSDNDVKDGVVVTSDGRILAKGDSEYVQKIPQYISKKVDDIATGNIPHESGKGNMQGFAIVDGYLYLYENVKDNDAGCESGDPCESGRIYKFQINDDGTTTQLIVTNDLPKVAHQGFSWYKDDTGLLWFVCQGGTEDGATAEDVIGYDGEIFTLDEANHGKHIAFVKWDDTESPDIFRYRTVGDYDANDRLTWVYGGYPTVSRETNELAIIFSDNRDATKRIVRVHDIDTLKSGDFTPKYDFRINMREVAYDGSASSQGFTFDGEIYTIAIGYVENENKHIGVYNTSGTMLDRVNFYHDSMIGEDHVEQEGLSLYDGELYSGIWYGGDFVILKHGAGNVNYKYEPEPPSQVHFNSVYDATIDAGNAFSVYEWDKTNELLSKACSFSKDTMYMGGTKIFNRLRETLIEFRPFGAVGDTNNPWLNFYSEDETDTDNNGCITGGAREIEIALNATENKWFKVTEAGNLRIGGGYFGFNAETDGSYTKVLNHTGTTLEIRSNGALADGGGINIYTDTHSTRARGMALFGNVSNGGHLYVDDIDESDPGIAGVIWNDNGTLKISAG